MGGTILKGTDKETVKGTTKRTATRMAITAGVLCVLLLLMLASFSSVASAATYSGNCGAEGDGSNLTWTLDTATGVLEISGSGAMKDYSYNVKARWYNYRSSIVKVVIGNSVTNIGERAFYECSSLNRVTINNGVTSIGISSFYNCSSLTSVIMPDSVTSIGSHAFAYCSGLTSVGMSGKLTSIGASAFSVCSSLSSVTIPDSVISIGEQAFYDCSSLTSIYVATGNKYYSNDNYGVLFNKDKTELIQYPIGHNRKDYTISDSVISIRGYAFRCCSSLTSVTIPDSITSIGYQAFFGCSSLGSVTIPDNINSIGSEAFWGCEKLSAVYISNLTSWCKITFDNWSANPLSYAGLLYINGSLARDITIPDSISSIGKHVFYNCDSLTSVRIPDSVTSIGYKTFCSCSSLSSITIPDSVTSIGDYAFYSCSSLSRANFYGSAPETVGSNVFSNCTADFTIYYIEGKSGWTSPTWQGYNSAVWAQSAFSGHNTATINYQGYAFGWYTMLDDNNNSLPAGVLIKYQFDGYSNVYSTKTTENGLICIKSPYMTESADLQVSFARQDGEALATTSDHLEVTVTPLAFTQEWKGRILLNGSASLGLEAGVSVGVAKAEAAVATIGGKAGIQTAMEIKLENMKSGEKSLTIVSTRELNLAAKAKAGLWANGGTSLGSVAEINAGKISGEGSYAANVGLGLKIDDYNPAALGQNLKIGGYVLESFHNTNVVIQHILKQLNLTSINETSNGYTVDLEANASLGEVNIDINQDGNALSTSLVSLGGKTLFEHKEKKNSDTTSTISSSVKADAEFSILNGLEYKSGGQASGYTASMKLDSSFWGQKFMSNDLELSADLSESDELKKIKLKTVDAQSSKNFILKETVNNSNYTVTYDGAAAQTLKEASSSVADFVTRKNSLLCSFCFYKILNDMNSCDARATYERSSEDTIDYYFPLEISAKAGVGLGIGFGIGGFTSNECVTESGEVFDGNNYITSQSDSASAAAENATTLGEIVGTAVQAAWDSVAGFFVDVKDKAVNGVKNGLAAIGKTTANWTIILTTWQDDNASVQTAESFDILAVTSDKADLAAAAVAATVGEFYLIEATAENGEVITDFSANPLPLTLGYTDDMLIAAGADNSMLAYLAIYYWDVERQVYQYIGGVVDAAAQTVFAEITKAGQYILAIDNCAPTVVDFSVSDSSASPTISANVTDLSGLAEFSFVLDDTELVTKDNLDDYYNYQNGYFSYEAADLSEGEHITTIYAKDAAGNAMTEAARLTFASDATLPVISDFTAAEYITSDSAIFTASASDTSLSQVKLHLSIIDQFGNTNNAAVIMEEADGAYVAEVKDLPVGSTLQSWITATDAAGNTAESAQKNSIVLCGADSDNYVTVTQIEQQTITLYAGNAAGTQLAGRVIAAVYNEDGQMTAVKSKSVTVAAPAAITLSMGTDLSEDTNLKVFFVDSDSQVPLCECFAVKNAVSLSNFAKII